MRRFLTIEYYRIRGYAKKALEFYRLWKEWCRVFDEVLDSEMNKL